MCLCNASNNMTYMPAKRNITNFKGKKWVGG